MSDKHKQHKEDNQSQYAVEYEPYISREDIESYRKYDWDGCIGNRFFEIGDFSYCAVCQELFRGDRLERREKRYCRRKDDGETN